MVQQWMAATLKRFVERSVCRNGGCVLFLSNQCKTFVWYFLAVHWWFHMKNLGTKFARIRIYDLPIPSCFSTTTTMCFPPLGSDDPPRCPCDSKVGCLSAAIDLNVMDPSCGLVQALVTSTKHNRFTRITMGNGWTWWFFWGFHGKIHDNIVQ